MLKRLGRLIAVREHKRQRAEQRLREALEKEQQYKDAHLRALARCNELQCEIQATQTQWFESLQQGVSKIQAAHEYLQAQRELLENARAITAVRAEHRAVAEAERQKAAACLNHARLKYEHSLDQRAACEQQYARLRDTLREEQALENWNVSRMSRTS